jgi:hypothetical protein
MGMMPSRGLRFPGLSAVGQSAAGLAAGLATAPLPAPTGTGTLSPTAILDLSVPATWLLGRDPDGVTDDMPAIQAYLDDSTTNRFVRFEGRANDYLAKTTLNVRGKHGLHLVGYNGGRISGHSTLAKAVLSTWNSGDAVSYAAGTGLMQQLTGNALTGRTRPGDTVLPPFATIGDAANYVAGDYVMIRCGEVTTLVPICEMNKVRSVNTGTGVLTLEWPINWRYRDMGDGKDYSVTLITNLVTERLRLVDLHLKHATFRPLNLFHFVDLWTRGLTLQGLGAVAMRARHFDVEYRSIIEGTWNSNCRPYGGGIDAGSCNGRIKAIVTSQGLAIVHFHEGLANIEVDVDVQCGTTDAGPSESWPVVSVKACTRNLHFKRVKIVNAPGGGPAFASAQSSAYPGIGNHNLVVDSLTIEGTVTTGRALDHETNQGVATIKHLDASGAVVPTAGTNTGTAASSKLAKQITLIAAAGLGASTGTQDGEPYWQCADATATGVQYEEDIPPGGWTHAELAVETENYDDATSGHSIVWLERYRTAAAGTACDYTGNPDTTLTQAYDAAGSPRMVRMVKSLGRAGRVGFSLLRNGAAGSDTLTGNARIRRATLTYYVALGDADQGLQPVVLTNVGASSFATILAASTVGAIWEIKIAGPTNADYAIGTVIGGTTPVIVGAANLGDFALAVNSTNIRITNANAAAKLAKGSIVRIA